MEEPSRAPSMMLSRRASIALGLFLALGLLPACGSTRSREQRDHVRRIVPGVRVGPWLLGHSTTAEVLGQDEAEARERHAEQGLHFQFASGRLLRGVTVTSPDFRTAEGLRVGSSAAEVRRALGLPLVAELGAHRGPPRAGEMVYEGIVFALDGERVVSIQVLAPGER